VYARSHRVRVLRIPPASKHARLTEVRVELEPIEPRSISLRVTNIAGDEVGQVVIALLDGDGDAVREWNFVGPPAAHKVPIIDDLPSENVRLKIWGHRNPLLFRVVSAEARGQTVEVALPRGARLQLPFPAGIEGAYSLNVIRIADGLVVPMRFGTSYESASLVPAGRYRAQIVRHEVNLVPTKYQEAPTVKTTVLRQIEFDVEAGVDRKLDWAASD